MDIQERAKKIKLLLLDVDGVLTDGKIIIGGFLGKIKNYDVNDGLGIVLLKRAGLRCAIITAEASAAVKIRAKRVRVDKVYQNHYKIRSLADIKKRFKVSEEEICFIGDDLIDIPLLRRVGLAVAVPNAVPEVKEMVYHITQKKGGEGAVREMCELILKAQDKWTKVTKAYFE